MIKMGIKENGLPALIVLLVIGVTLVVGCMESEKHTEKPKLTLTNTYSNYNISFKYPSDMEITEFGLLEEEPTNESGLIQGEIEKEDLYHYFGVSWIKTMYFNVEGAIAGAIASAESEGAEVTKKERGELEHMGHTVTYQIYEVYANAVKGPSHLYGIIGVWYCDQTGRGFSINLMYSEQDVLPLFEEYLDNFVCH